MQPRQEEYAASACPRSRINLAGVWPAGRKRRSNNRAPLRQLAEDISEGRYAFPQAIEIVFRNDEDVHGGASPDRGIPGLIGEQGHLAKVVSVSQSSQKPLRTVLLPQNVAFTFRDDVYVIPQVALLEDDIAGLEMLMSDAGFGCDFGLRQLGGEQQAQQPVGGDPDLAIPSGHLHQVDATPEEPGSQTGQLDPKDLGDGRPVAQRTHGSKAFEGELIPLSASNTGSDVDGRGSGLPDGVLRGRWNSCACHGLDRSTVAKRPNPAFV